MKYKRILITITLIAAWLGALRQQGHAQNIYSINVVGYVNVTLTSGYNFIANPLDASMGGTLPWYNTLTNLINTNTVFTGTLANGTRAYVWDTANGAFLPPVTYSTFTHRWSGNPDLPPGKGFVLYSPSVSDWVNTFVGQVCTGYSTNFVAGGNKFSLLASMIPLDAFLSGPLLTNGPDYGLDFPCIDGDNVYLFSSAGQNYSDAFTYFDGYGWFDPKGQVDIRGPFINLAHSFFVQNPGPDTNWVIYLNLDDNPTNSLAQSRVASQREASAVIRGITTCSGNVSLQILNPGGGSYNILYSADRVSWNPVALNQTGSAWTGKQPGAGRGLYRLVKP
jgi:hypothetical protein